MIVTYDGGIVVTSDETAAMKFPGTTMLAAKQEFSTRHRRRTDLFEETALLAALRSPVCFG